MPPSSAQQNIWKQMNYTPPRGPCNHKESLLSPKCPCLRFMLHPLKLTSSFTCDGCNHHASFHSMASPADDAILARWSSEQSTSSSTTAHPPPSSLPDISSASGPRSRKRPRRALLEAGPSATNASAAPSETTATTTSAIDALDMLFSDDVEFLNSHGGEDGSSSSNRQRPGSKTWGDRFSSWSFGGRAGEEPVKTPPKRVHSVGSGSGGGGGGGGGRRRRGNGNSNGGGGGGSSSRRRGGPQEDEDGEWAGGSDVVDLD